MAHHRGDSPKRRGREFESQRVKWLLSYALSYCAPQTRRNTFLITITRSRCAIPRISRTSHRAPPRDWASERLLHPRCDDQEASYVLDIFNASQRFRRISRASDESFNPLPFCPRLFSPRTESIPVAREIYFGKLLRACTRVVRRSKMYGWYVSMVRSWLSRYLSLIKCKSNKGEMNLLTFLQ